jgi:hypothetical protein
MRVSAIPIVNVANIRSAKVRPLINSRGKDDTITGFETSQPQAFPAEEIFGNRQREAWTTVRERCVGHNVALQAVDEGDAGIFAAPAICP